MKFVRIPDGKFTMGSPEGEADRRKDEQQHEVEITKPFYLGAYTVTQAEFEKVMGYNPSYFSAGAKGTEGASYFDWSKPGGGAEKVKGLDTSRFPVENVSWDEAQEFIKKLNEREKKAEPRLVYRLPTEAEWEYACRGGAVSSKTFNIDGRPTDQLSSKDANIDGRYPYGGAEQGDYLDRTCKVGSYQANGCGLYDMHGNVWQWCADWYAEDYYSKSPRKDPRGTAKASARVLRGGGWGDHGRNCRAARRLGRGPGDRYHGTGFRLAAVPLGE
jgi:formylglycine-generating enzyme required for sulfatase activity